MNASFSVIIRLECTVLFVLMKTVKLLLFFKGERKKLLKNCFFSVIKLVFRGERECYLFCYYVIFRYCVFFRYTQSSIEIEVIVVKKHMFLNFVKNYLRHNEKKET